MPLFRARVAAALVVVSLFFASASLWAQYPKAPPEVVPNDNRTPAGAVHNGVLNLNLNVGYGVWHPDGQQPSGIVLQAFSQQGEAPRIPGPLLRVRTGAEVHATIHNSLHLATVVLHGFGPHDGQPAAVVSIPPQSNREIDFRAGQPGNYLYWATTTDQTLGPRPFGVDTALNGAFIIDPPGPVSPDRVFVITMWRDPNFVFGFKPTAPEAMALNGLSWPDTEKLTYHVGDHIRWRIVNGTYDPHPMHLHGFHFQVISDSNGEVEQEIPPSRRMREDTRYLRPGECVTLEWTPTLPGHWLYHCHVLDHIAPELKETRLFPGEGGMNQAANMAAEMMNGQHHAMGGLALGLDILPNPADPLVAPPPVMHHLSLYVRPAPGGRLGYALAQDDAVPPVSDARVPGPPVILYQGQTTEITIHNQTKVSTSVHWHGIALRSYYDGVPYWSGEDNKLEPDIAPGQTFTVQITPPLAGTFIYHSHWNDDSQMLDGLYGPLVVLKPGQHYDPVHDKIFVLGEVPTTRTGQIVFNGSAASETITLHAGQPCRLRLINITRNQSGLRFGLRTLDADGHAHAMPWRPIAKDGADLPPALQVPGNGRIISVGEKLDVTLRPQPGDFELYGGGSLQHPMAVVKFHVVE